MKKQKRIMALSLIVMMLLGFTACENNGDLSVGSIVTANEDKEAVLTEHIDAETEVETGYSVEKLDSGDTKIYHAEKETAEKRMESFPVQYSASGKVYPGAIFFANTKMLHGNPDSIDSNELPRSDLSIKMTSGSESVGSTTVQSLDAGKVSEAIKELESKMTAPYVKKTYACAAAWSDDQVDASLGICDASAYFGVDYKAMRHGQATQMIIVYDSTYYSVETETDDANLLFAENADTEALKNQGVNENNPDLLEVSSVDYGKRYVVTLKSSIRDVRKVLDAWSGGISEDGISDNNNYNIFRNTQYRVFELSSKGYDLVKETDNLEEVNTILKSAEGNADMRSLMPLRFKAVFVTDKSIAVGNISADYYEGCIEYKGSTHVKIDKPATAQQYLVKHSRFYARAIIGIDDKGNFKLGEWKIIKDNATSSSDKCYEFDVDSNYAEYGYSVDILAGIDWPYSNSFWNQSKGFAENIYIELGGSSPRTVSIRINVNDKLVFTDSHCDSHKKDIFNPLG